MTALALTDSHLAIQSRLAAGRIPRYGPFLMVMARSVFILLAQGITLLILRQLNVQNPTVALRNWFTVYGTLADLGCLGLLIWLTRREGIRLFDLLSFDKTRLKKDILLGLGVFTVVFPVTVFGFGRLAMLVAYGNLTPEFPEFTFIRTLPLLAVLYSRILWWPIWSATEEMTYDGYALPRLVAITKSPWLSIAIVSFFFSLQHSFLSLADFQYGLYMFLLFVPLTVALGLIYLRVRRLLPLIIGHWLMDLTNAVFILQIG
ncbi:MAG TPA: CPBP family intramembrane glutamic endopeptidase [Anaerolineaceae bacterium]|nr:CPBP family intramembrane glutamic endopeptidase [Anaerolineaceae bacterium]